MPNYDYKCSKCEHELEVFQSMSEEPLKKCPKCGKNSLKRMIGTGAGIIFKGGGFYETDYKRSSSKKDGSSSSDSKESKSSGGDSKSGGCGSSCGCS